MTRQAAYCVRVSFVLVERADDGAVYETTHGTFADFEAVVWRGDRLADALAVRDRFAALPEVEIAEILGWGDGEWHATPTRKGAPPE